MTGGRPLDPAGDVSVVIVAYRTPDLLTECPGSFEQHRARRVAEVIVVDNGEQPDEGPPTARFPWVRYERNATNVHVRRGVNQGVRLATRQYVLLLNPDTRLLDGEAVARLAEERRTAFCELLPSYRVEEVGSPHRLLALPD